jgi:Family of unknown function (DUF6489)
MKISIDIEATPDEVREFFGWPPIQPLQQELIRVMQENMNKGVAGFEPLSLMKSCFLCLCRAWRTCKKCLVMR